MIQLFIIIVITILAGSVIGLQIQVEKIDKNSLRKDKNKLNWYSKILLMVCAGLIIGAFYLPFLLKSTAISTLSELSAKGALGDAISGIMNPFIGIAGVIVTGLAFWIQYKANLQVQEQFTLQQFDAQFNEMIRLHKENVNEMEIEGYVFEDDLEEVIIEVKHMLFPKEEDKHFDYRKVNSNTIESLKSGKVFNKINKSTKGRKVFVTMKTELECILSLLVKSNLVLDEINMKICYSIFFFGLDYFEKNYIKSVVENSSNKETKIEEFIENLKNARASHGYNYSNYNMPKNRKIYKGVKLYFNYKPFSGHSSRLGHYYRHLYLIVKSIAIPQSIQLDEIEKKEYLKILRAQLSNHEQAMLFYNWLGDYGKEWQPKEYDGNRFFTKYNMIHNLWYTELFDHEHIGKNIKFLKDEFGKDYPNRNKASSPKIKEMFEIDEN